MVEGQVGVAEQSSAGSLRKSGQEDADNDSTEMNTAEDGAK